MREGGGQERCGQAVADEVEEGLRVVGFEGDVSLHAGGGEGAVDGDACAPGFGAVGECLVCDRGEFDVWAGGEGVVLVDGEGHRLAAERRQLQTGGAAAGEGEKREIELAVADLRGHLDRVSLADAQLDVEVSGPEGGEQRRDVERPQRARLHDPHGDDSSQPPAPLHHTSHAPAGIPAFTAFLAAVVAQIAAGSWQVRRLLATGMATLSAGLALVVLATWLPSLALFLIGGAVAGAGAGLLFKGGIVTVTLIAAPERRAEALAGLLAERQPTVR